MAALSKLNGSVKPTNTKLFQRVEFPIQLSNPVCLFHALFSKVPNEHCIATKSYFILINAEMPICQKAKKKQYLGRRATFKNFPLNL